MTTRRAFAGPPPAGKERRERFLAHANRYTPLIGISHGTGVLVVPCSAEPAAPGASLVDEAMRALGETGRLARTAGKTFLDVGARAGARSIAALLAHGFRDAVAIEPDPASCRLLGVNAVLNGLERQISLRSIAVDDSRSLDSLVAEGALDADAVGLAVIDAAPGLAVVQGARALRERLIPLVVPLARPAGDEQVHALVGLLDGYTAAVGVVRAGRPRRSDPVPIHDLPRLAASGERFALVL